ncbi:protein indeterminate-domain 5, chloroplastic-like [Vigna unguiculata]|uniref:protein indeterminate-domain 5, chloroplastic-like n=1 Tax=Vigna unguiculata TaxID=3917 RepID=UPI001015E85E|nr:protein indeterminate-domain 5, chloroplastic-like [Vigna unguiculata]
MAAPFSSASLFGIREEDQNQMKQQHSSTTTPSSSSTPAAPPPQKKRRNQPGTPNPDAEVIALSPKTLMATNRFICEVCNKGFQREQNLQLHRRGHNLPWKLKQKSNKEPKRKVYLCPEPTCVHHDPSRALGDLTGIKKHYSRKHGEKKWKCDKCSKKYAVQSDWKAHSKTCGTREYRCDCGTLFSRRDSFITHRAFCDALAQESAREPPNLSSAIGNQLFGNSNNMSLGLSQNLGSQIPSIHDQNAQPSDLLRFGGAPRTGPFDHILPPNMASPFRHCSHQTMQLQNPPFFMPEPNQNQNQNYHDHQQGLISNKPFQGMIQLSDLNNSNTPAASNLFNLPFLSNRGHTPNFSEEHHFNPTEASNFFTEGTIIGTDHQTSSTAPSLFSTALQNSTNMSHMSATALLQKAAQMGAASSSTNNSASSLLRSLASKSDHGPLIAAANYSTILNSSVQDMITLPGFEAYDHGISNKEPKLSVGGSDRLTRDFLGVAQQQQQQRGFNLSSLEAETNNAAPSGQSFGGGANFQ